MTSTLRSVTPAALLAALALALAGCGGSGPKTVTRTVVTTAPATGTGTASTTPTATGPSAGDGSAYKAQINALGSAFKDAVVRTRAKTSSATDNAARVRVLGEFRGEFSALAAKLAQLRPPSRAKAEHERVIALLRKGAVDIGKVQAAIRARDVQAIKATTSSFQLDAARIQAALQALRIAVA